MRRGPAAAGAALAGYALLQLLGRRAGSTATERRRPLPGDELVQHPQLVMNHAATIDAPADRVWPWLTQMGWHLGGFYTPGWGDGVARPQLADRPGSSRSREGQLSGKSNRSTHLPGRRTRVQLRVRGRGEPWWFIALYAAAIVPADFVMSTGMLRGLRRRVEHP